MSDHLTTQEAARRLNVSDTTIWNLSKDGKLHPIRLGWQCVWVREEVERVREERAARV